MVLRRLGAALGLLFLLCAPIIVPAQPTAPELRVFLITGQSNAQGSSHGPGGPRVPGGRALAYYQGAIVDANDPVGNAIGGSAWPSFTLTYYALTNVAVMVVPAAVGGTAQCDAEQNSTGSWGPAGSLRAEAVARASASMVAARAAGWSPVFAGFLHAQGEASAQAITVGKITAADYRSCLEEMIDWLRAEPIDGAPRPDAPFYVSRTGAPGAGDNAAFAQVRAAQELVAADKPGVRIAFYGALSFLSRGLMCIDVCGGDRHYLQQGYDEMGREMARVAAGMSAASYPGGSYTVDSLTARGSIKLASGAVLDSVGQFDVVRSTGSLNTLRDADGDDNIILFKTSGMIRMRIGQMGSYSFQLQDSQRGNAPVWSYSELTGAFSIPNLSSPHGITTIPSRTMAPYTRRDSVLAPVPGLQVSLLGGYAYKCEGRLVVSGAGLRVSLGAENGLVLGTLNVSARAYAGNRLVQNETRTSLVSIVQTQEPVTDVYLDAIVAVSAPGALIVSVAQDGDISPTIGPNSYLICQRS